MEYVIADLVDGRNRALYDEVSRNVPVVLEMSDDDGWGAIIKDGNGHVCYSATLHPISSFTHELLHLKCDYSGMGRPGFMVKSPPQDPDNLYREIKEQLSYIYNQLIHHKIFQEFTALGFPPDEFLADVDKEEASNCGKRDIPELVEWHKKNRRDIPCRLFIYPYLFLHSPNHTSEESQTLLKKLRNISDQNFYKMNKLIDRLKEDKTPDMRKYLLQVFMYCDRPEIGFGYDENQILWASEFR
jgi:hypothetical protein